MTLSVNRIAYMLAILLNLGLAAFLVQIASGSVPIPTGWEWATPIVIAVVTGACALLPRVGSEGLSAQVDTLKAQGVPRSEMVVLSQDEAASALAGQLTPEQIEQIANALHGPIVDALVARMQQTPAIDPLPKPRYGSAPESIGDQIGGLIDRSEAGRG